FAYSRPIRKGPALYAFGVSTGIPANDPESERIARWMRECIGDRSFVAGRLKDIYELNIVTRRHLDFPIDRENLHAWIEANPGRGAITQLDNTRFLWELP